MNSLKLGFGLERGTGTGSGTDTGAKTGAREPQTWRRDRTQENAVEPKSCNGKMRENALDLELSAGIAVAQESRRLFDNQGYREPGVSLDKAKWLTTSEAAQYLRVSISSIKAMIYRGQLRAHKLGNRNRFLKDELDRLITLPVFR